MSGILCPTNLENLIKDYDTFIQGPDNSTVTLSDGYVTPSYRQFAINEFSRAGVLWSNVKIYKKDDMVTKNEIVYIALKDNKSEDPYLYQNSWKALERVGVVEGSGLSAYVTFLIDDFDILESRHVTSIVSVSEDTFEITVDDTVRVGLGNRLVFAMSYSSEDIDIDKISSEKDGDGEYKFFIYSRTVQNDDNKIRIQINKNYVDWNAKIDIVFMEV